MKKIILYTALALSAIGCSKEQGEEQADRKVVIPIKPLYDGATIKTKAALEDWNETTVGLAYHSGTVANLFDQYVPVEVKDEEGGKINMGIEYPLDGGMIYVRGYYPAEAPLNSGVVPYDISKGNVDIMVSNMVNGSSGSPISTPLKFEHQLTRLTFTLQCQENKSYPDYILGLMVEGTRMWGSLDLATGTVNYSVPGSIFAGKLGGFPVPQSYEDAEVIDVMVEPDKPLKIYLLTSDKNESEKYIVYEGKTNPNTGRSYEIEGLEFLGRDVDGKIGGEKGKQYKISLKFSGKTIMVDKTSVEPWTSVSAIDSGLTNQTGNNNGWY